MSGRFEVHPDSSGGYRFVLLAASGDVVAFGQGFASPAAARAGCALVQATCDEGPDIVETDG